MVRMVQLPTWPTDISTISSLRWDDDYTAVYEGLLVAVLGRFPGLKCVQTVAPVQFMWRDSKQWRRFGFRIRGGVIAAEYLGWDDGKWDLLHQTEFVLADPECFLKLFEFIGDREVLKADRGPKPSGTSKLLVRLLHAQGWVCAICGQKIGLVSEANIDHWIPRAHGGSSARENLRAAHIVCNHNKGSRLPDRLPPKVRAELVPDLRCGICCGPARALRVTRVTFLLPHIWVVCEYCGEVSFIERVKR